MLDIDESFVGLNSSIASPLTSSPIALWSLLKEKVLSEKNLFDVLHFFRLGNLSILPVVDKENNYLGCICERILLQKLCEILKVENQGGIIHLQIRIIDYSLAQIAQIVEGNGARILSSMCLSLIHI